MTSLRNFVTLAIPDRSPDLFGPGADHKRASSLWVMSQVSIRPDIRMQPEQPNNHHPDRSPNDHRELGRSGGISPFLNQPG
jgi:hypothetical protein